MIEVFVGFDTEDAVHPEADDALLRLCRLLTDAGLRGCFFFVGEKARVLRERGRHDVLAALAPHEIDYHGNWWYEFPESAIAYGERLPWDEAIEYGTRIELDGLHDVAEITGQWPTAWVQHQNNVHAHMPHLFRRLGVPVWNGGFGSGPLTGWLMDQLVLTRNSHVMSSQGSATDAQHDPLHRVPPEAVMDPDAEFRAFQERFDQLAAERGTVCLLGHPTVWVMADWFGWYEWPQYTHDPRPTPYPRGRAWRRSTPRSAADSEAHFAWTQRAFDWLAARADVNVTTFGDWYRQRREPGIAWLTLDDVDTVAAATADRPRDLAVGGTTLSAADAFGVLVHLFAAIERQGRLPDRVPVQRLLGPVEAPWPAAAVELRRAAWFSAAPALYDRLVTERRLPGTIRAEWTDVGPAAMAMLLARVWRAYRADGAWPMTMAVEPPGDVPAAADLAFFAHPVASTSNRPPGLELRRLADLVRWQSWSYRDAVVR